MKEVVLVFPRAELLLNFITDNKISSTEVSSSDRRLTGILSDEQIAIACTTYKAYLERIISSY